MSNILCLTWPVTSHVAPGINLLTLSERFCPGLSITVWIFPPRLLVFEKDEGAATTPPPAEGRGQIGPAGRGLNVLLVNFFFRKIGFVCAHRNQRVKWHLLRNTPIASKTKMQNRTTLMSIGVQKWIIKCPPIVKFGTPPCSFSQIARKRPAPGFHLPSYLILHLLGNLCESINLGSCNVRWPGQVKRPNLTKNFTIASHLVFQEKSWNFRNLMRLSMPTKCLSEIFNICDLRSGHFRDLHITHYTRRSQWTKIQVLFYASSWGYRNGIASCKVFSDAPTSKWHFSSLTSLKVIEVTRRHQQFCCQ